ncbi:dephospho-CoA kinase [Daejeonella rubra]|uniref:Dephospho-CoA kinase n=1 Tax=Daejeonella rubra TaxID=990371 RepID=A0A1G9QG72_9SPHI|nr:dephospho-CoA kinase [Daejeonella rubra]SDM10019.1 dephospho-CoA kinase [Daejeonella rubra]
MMLKIGITGGIGSGKTTVCKVFELLGIPVFYADTVAKSIMHTDPVLKQEILKTFGEKSYFSDGELNRPYISSIVFNNESELTKLNALVHPAVFRAFDAWLAKHSDAPYIIKEAALLFETESYKMCDLSVLVISPEASRIRRVIARDGISTEEILLRMDRQFSDEQKIKLADHILINDESRLLIPQILTLHEQFLKIGT